MKIEFVELSTSPSAWSLKSAALSSERLDASYYRPEYLRAAQQIEDLPMQVQDFRQISSKLNCGATPPLVEYGTQGVPLIRTSNVRPNLYDATDTLLVPNFQLTPSSNVAILPEDILYTMSGSVGFTAVYPQGGELASCSNTIARARLISGGRHDPYYVALFLNSTLGVLQSDRLVSGGVLGHVMPNSVKRLRVALPDTDIQHAVGIKLRKAERLREFAKRSFSSARALLDKALALQTLERPEGNLAWCTSKGLSGTRLDAEYYQPRYTALEAHIAKLKAKHVRTDILGDLIDDGGYGVLPPSEVYGTGDLQFMRSEALDHFVIDASDPILVPGEYRNPKAIAREGDLLLEVKGKIEGGAICPPAIAGWLLNGSIYRMTLKAEVDPGYVIAVLLSEFGDLQKKRAAANSIISYLSLDFLNALVIPRANPSTEAEIGSHVRSYQQSVTDSVALTKAAQADIERLIAGKLDVPSLVSESKAIEIWLQQNSIKKKQGSA
jgi:hypothetical protein